MATKVLDSFGYRYIINQKGNSILFDCQTPGREADAPGEWWRSRFAIFEDSRVLTIESFLTDALYNAARRNWVLELTCLINEAFPTGCFAFSWQHGWVQYRSHVSFDNREVTHGEVEALLNSISYPIRVWERAFEYRHSPTDPRTALEASLHQLDGLEYGVGKTTMKALLKVSSAESTPEVAESVSPNLSLV